ncbi:unnamed protein product [Notodromas monacha]|uniref:C2H2-type domain-containing protein n=1 Tax=Notodromas monacha TaxID=399045 RepID=A0A7R9G9V1_9CRUS|nr:unnamed protein product [Notodromas monacha]CAG0913456.1 unnamed protein product [Notodromas monacha]
MELHRLDNCDKVSCITCRTTMTKDALHEHVKLKHCGKIGRTKDERLALGIKARQCLRCSFVGMTETAFGIHAALEHREEQVIKCDECDKEFKTQRTLRDHENSVHGKKTYECAECGLVNSSRTAYERHLETHKPMKGMKLCPQCGKALRAGSLLGHMIVFHNHPMRKKCNYCGLIVPSDWELSKHKESVHGIKKTKIKRSPRLCVDCGKTFRNVEEFVSHRIKMHGDQAPEGRKPHTCVVCGDIFPTRDLGRKHEKNIHGLDYVEQAERGIECELCGVTAKEKYEFRDHLHTSHGIKVPIKQIRDYVKLPEPRTEKKKKRMKRKWCVVCAVSLPVVGSEKMNESLKSAPNVRAFLAENRVADPDALQSSSMGICDKCFVNVSIIDELMEMTRIKLFALTTKVATSRATSLLSEEPPNEYRGNNGVIENPMAVEAGSAFPLMIETEVKDFMLLEYNNGCVGDVAQKRCVSDPVQEDLVTQDSQEKATIACDECGESFTAHRLLVRHSVEIHGRQVPKLSRSPPKEAYCEDCGKQYKKVSDCLNHRRRVHGDSTMQIDTQPCELCMKVFGSKDSLRYHLRGVHGFEYAIQLKEGIECRICSARAREKHEFLRHLRGAHNIQVSTRTLKQFMKPPAKLFRMGEMKTDEFGVLNMNRSRCVICMCDVASGSSSALRMPLKSCESTRLFLTLYEIVETSLSEFIDGDHLCGRCLALVIVSDNLMFAALQKIEICKNLHRHQVSTDVQREAYSVEERCDQVQKMSPCDSMEVLNSSTEAELMLNLSNLVQETIEEEELEKPCELDPMHEFKSIEEDSVQFSETRPSSKIPFWSTKNPVHRESKPFKESGINSSTGKPVYVIDGYSFEWTKNGRENANVRIVRCSHYWNPEVRCKVWGAVNLEEGKFFYKIPFNGDNHNHADPTFNVSLGNRPRALRKERLEKRLVSSRISNDSAKRPLQCEECDYSTKFQHTLFRHYQESHSLPNGLACFECGRSFTALLELSEHVQLHYLEMVDKITCISCRLTMQKNSLNSHIHSKHFGKIGRTEVEREAMGLKLLKCPGCSFRVESMSKFRLHRMQAHPGEDEAFECEICAQRFSSWTAMKVHRRQFHNRSGKNYSCEQCGVNFDTMHKYYYHNSVAHKPLNGKKLCPECGELFNSKALKDHMVSVHEKPAFRKCEHCGEYETTAHKMLMHLRLVHGIDIPRPKRKFHVCEDCGKRYDRRSLYSNHRRRHHGDDLRDGLGSNPCTYCKVNFPTRLGLRAHWKGAHGWDYAQQSREGLKCIMCGTLEREKNGFRDHLKSTHGIVVAARNIKPYVKPPSDSGGATTMVHKNVQSQELYEYPLMDNEGSTENLFALGYVQMENRDCFLCGAVISEKSESSVRERPLKWFSDPQQFMTEHVLSNEDSVPEGSDAEMCDRCLALVVICDTLMVAFQTKVKVCQELFAEKARFSVAEPDFEKSAAEERKSVEKLTGVETKTSQKRKFQENRLERLKCINR